MYLDHKTPGGKAQARTLFLQVVIRCVVINMKDMYLMAHPTPSL